MNKSEQITVIIISVIYLPLIILTILVHLKKIKIPKVSFKKVIKINLLLIFIITIAILIINHINFLDYEKPISYKEIDRITFKNFRGLNLFKKELYGEKNFAYVYTTIDCSYTKDSMEIGAVFHPSRSYVYDKKSNSVDLLTHELYHFKITEIFARKIRKEIVQKKITDKDEIKRILDKNILLEDEFQKKYDYDTFHSYVYKEQKKYEKVIDSTLNNLNDFKDLKIRFYEK